jgi:NAD(P)H-dependent FMN reductase
MSYFLALSGSSTKFSKSGFLLQAIGGILEQRDLDFQAIHASDLPPNEPATVRIVHQFVADTNDQIQHAAALVIVTPATKEAPTLLTSLLRLLPDNAFAKKPVLLFATGGLPGHVAILEYELKQTFFRLGTKAIAARVHVGTGGWLIVGDDRPRLSRGSEREIAYAIDLVLGSMAAPADSVGVSASVRGAVARRT